MRTLSRLSRLLLPFALWPVVAGCVFKGTVADSTSYNPCVKSFTRGTISRFAPVYLIFAEDAPPEKTQEGGLGKYFSIKPEVKGEFSFDDAHTVVFRPAVSFERNTEYRITADLSPWFTTRQGERYFSFRFSTCPPALHVEQEAFGVGDDETGFELTYTLRTPDKETPETLESLVRVSEKTEIRWQHAPDGKKHTLALGRVPARAKSYELELSAKPNKLGLKEGRLLTTRIPAAGEFAVYETRFVGEPERYVEVVFTEKLDEAQQLRGLAYLVGSENETLASEGNTLRLYPGKDLAGPTQVFLSAGVRSGKGQTLGRDLTEVVDVADALPAVRFAGEGNIIPQSAELNLPFQAIYLRGVVARVIRIYENNVGQFMQSNDLSGDYGLAAVGRLEARKTIFFDGEEQRLRNWQTYAIRLNDLIDPEPGAIYRIELSPTRELSAYPCENAAPQRTKEEIWADDELKLKEELARYDNGGYYYYYGETEYDYDDPYERNDPCSNNYYYNNVKAKNVLATNLGLMAFGGKADRMCVLVHNLLSALPEKETSLAFYNYQHQLVGAGVTGEQGRADVQLKGKPFYLIASKGKQRAYLRLDAGSALSVSSFDVAGDVVQQGVKGFIYGERGVWRPGDTLRLGFMLNDRLNTFPANHPVTMELFNPHGQLYLRKTQTQGTLGVYAFDMPTEPDAPTGAWQARAEAGGVSFTKKIRIETIKPNRLKINLGLPGKPALENAPVFIPLHAEWLQGAAAGGLKYQVQTSFAPVETAFPGFRGYVFDDPSKIFRSEEDKLFAGTTDQAGDALIEARFGTNASAPGMLRADLVTRVYEESGNFSIDGSSLLCSPYKRYAGIRSPQKDREPLDTGKPHVFELVSVDHLGAPAQARLRVEVFHLRRYWWWESSSRQLGQYMSDAYLKPWKQFEVQTGPGGRASFSLEMERAGWGTYFIRVKDEGSGHTTGALSYFDWPGYDRNQGANDAASLLDVRADKREYAPGEKIKLRFPSAEGARAIVCIANGTKTLGFSEHLCRAGETSVLIDVTEEMQPNVYLYVALLQAYGNGRNDLPIRMYGVIPAMVASPGSRLRPEIKTGAECKPESLCHITVAEKDGRPMAYTLAVVDEGLLDLTHFPTPDPWQAFNAREALGVSSWDAYSQVIGAYGGRIEQLFSIGGDEALIRAGKAVVNRFKPVVRFEGPFLLKKGEKKRHSFLMPNYNGRVRVMVVAGNGQAYGQAEQSVVVRKPVMLLGALPRVVGVGEEILVPASVFATEEGIGPVKVSLACSATMSVVGASSQELHFTGKGEKQALFRIRVKDRPGAGKITLTATGKGETSTYEAEIEIRSVSRPIAALTPVELRPGETWKDRLRLPGADGGNSLRLEVSTVPPLNLGFRLGYLLGYPHGCVEQITSKAFPQLYLKDFASLTGKETKTAEEAVKETLRRYRSYQTSAGGFSYWPNESDGPAGDWVTAYAAHFMLEAEARGYLVPASAKRDALNYLKKTAREWTAKRTAYADGGDDDLHDLRTQAYRLYVLALGQAPELGAMNRLKEYRGFRGTARWLLAAAYAAAGREDAAEETLSAEPALLFDTYAYDPYTFGSSFRDLGICLQTLCLLKRERQATETARKIADVLSSEKWLSTQETAFGLIGVASYMNRFGASGGVDFGYTLAGKTERVKTDKPLWSAELLDRAASAVDVELRNPGKGALFVRLVGRGLPSQDAVAPHANGISLNVDYVNNQGRTIDVSRLPQAGNFTALIRIRNTGPGPIRNLAVTQIVPSGWEILNTRYLGEGSAEAPGGGVDYQDVRDDRIYSYVNHLSAGAEVKLRIRLAAVYAGKFYLPPIYCESMYDNLIQANTEGKHVSVIAGDESAGNF
jgi:uncharacterized protein YfaS (alpha-2-macroglobulin family)